MDGTVDAPAVYGSWMVPERLGEIRVDDGSDSYQPIDTVANPDGLPCNVANGRGSIANNARFEVLDETGESVGFGELEGATLMDSNAERVCAFFFAVPLTRSATSYTFDIAGSDAYDITVEADRLFVDPAAEDQTIGTMTIAAGDPPTGLVMDPRVYFDLP